MSLFNKYTKQTLYTFIYKPKTMAKNQFNLPSCFSGTCQVCKNCCGNVSENPSHCEETMLTQRSKTLLKFYKDNMEESTKTYWKETSALCKRYDYRNMNDRGELPVSFKKDAYYIDRDPEVYKLQPPSDNICHNPECQIIYENTHDHQKRRFQQVPLYKGNYTSLCLRCVC